MLPPKQRGDERWQPQDRHEGSENTSQRWSRRARLSLQRPDILAMLDGAEQEHDQAGADT
jgi:hypothetical protein